MLKSILRHAKRTVGRVLRAPGFSGAVVSMPKPVSDHGLKLEKLGTTYGGWKIPADRIDKDWICYCVGAGEDISFDCCLIEKYGCDVFVFDPTPRAISHVDELVQKIGSGQSMPVNNNPDVLYTLPAEKLDKLHFHDYGIWSQNTIQRFYTPKNNSHVSHSILNLQNTEEYFEADCRTLTNIMNQLGHNRIDLLKLDVEGAEYEILDSMLESHIRPRVIGIEFDEGNMPLDEGAPGRISNMMGKLMAADYVFVDQDGWNTLFVHKSEFA